MMRFSLILVGILAFSFQALAEKENLLKGRLSLRHDSPADFQNSLPFSSYVKKCLSEVELYLNLHGSREKWIQQAPASSGGHSYRTGTSVFGRWLEVTVDRLGNPALLITDSRKTETTTFNSSCQPQSKLSVGMDFSLLKPDSMAEWFTDESLQLLLSKRKKGLIYVWSPEMVYSAKYFRNFQNAARKLNLDFTPIIDPRSTLARVDEISKQYGVPPSKQKLNSVELYMRNITVHYPTSIVYKDGKIHESLIVGVMDERDVTNQILMRLAD